MNDKDNFPIESNVPQPESAKVKEGEETPNQRFTRLATSRVNKVLDEIRKLGNLTSANYKSSYKQRDEIIKALKSGVEELEYNFGGEKINKAKFRFQADLKLLDDSE